MTEDHQEYVTYMSCDSSPQGKRDWFNSLFCRIPVCDLRALLRAVRHSGDALLMVNAVLLVSAQTTTVDSERKTIGSAPPFAIAPSHPSPR
eukprot:2376908-Pyramimonas_sp.AAC.1